MPKKGGKHHFRRIIHRVKKAAPKPSLMGALSIAIPQGIAVIGNVPYVSFPVIAGASGMSMGDRLLNLLANETLAFTGYDIKNQLWNPRLAIINYGLAIGHRALRMFLGPRRVGKLAIW